MVELALAVPLLLFIIFAIIDFGLAINQYNNTTNLANLGARATAVWSTTNTKPGTCLYTRTAGSNTTTTTYTTLAGYIDCEGAIEGDLSNVAVTVCDPNSTTTISQGDSVSVHVNSTFSWLGILQGGVGRIGGVVGPSSAIASAATMRDEQGGTVTTAAGDWFGSDSNPIPGQTTGTIAAPTIAATGC